MRFATSFLSGIALSIVLAGSANASIQVTSVNRGVTVDGVTSSNSTTGTFNTSLTNTNEFGTAFASIESSIAAHTISVDGQASTVAVSNEVFGDALRSRIFFNVWFSLDQPYDFSLLGHLAGITETEGAIARASLIGPSANLSYVAGSGQLTQVNYFGTLSPGDYMLSVEGFPIVLGGLDAGWAYSYVGGVFPDGNPTAFTLTLIPLGPSGGIEAPVPEPTSLIVWSSVGLALAIMSRRRLFGL